MRILALYRYGKTLHRRERGDEVDVSPGDNRRDEHRYSKLDRRRKGLNPTYFTFYPQSCRYMVEYNLLYLSCSNNTHHIASPHKQPRTTISFLIFPLDERFSLELLILLIPPPVQQTTERIGHRS